jgi:hypothetical protein
MSESVNHQSTTVNDSSIPLLETDIFFADLLVVISFATLSLVAAVVFLFRMSADAWGGQLTMALFFLAVTIWIIFTPKTFHLYADRLVIKKPLTYLPATTTVIRLSAIKEVYIGRRGYPGRGTFMTVKTRSSTYQYRIASDIAFIDDFIDHLRVQGIKAEREAHC